MRIVWNRFCGNCHSRKRGRRGDWDERTTGMTDMTEMRERTEMMWGRVGEWANTNPEPETRNPEAEKRSKTKSQ